MDFRPCGREPEASETAVPPEEGVATSAPAGLDILVVDDNEDHRLIFTAYLAREGHRVSVIDNGRDALAMCRLNRFGVVIMDLRLPEVDGYEVTRRIRQLEEEAGRAPSIILAVSADALVEHRTMALEAGCNGYLSKPVRREHLMRALASLLGQDPRTTRSHTLELLGDCRP